MTHMIYELQHPVQYTESKTCKAIEFRGARYGDKDIVKNFLGALGKGASDGDILEPTGELISATGEIIGDATFPLSSDFVKLIAIPDILGCAEVLANFIFPQTGKGAGSNSDKKSGGKSS